MFKKRFISMLVLLAAVAMGAWAEGSVKFSVLNVYNGNTTDKVSSGCLVYFLTTTMASIDSWASQPSLKAFKNALEGKYSTGLTSDGTLSNTTVSNSSLGLTDGASVTSYLLIFNSSEITEGVSYYITNTKDFTAGTSGTVNAIFGNQATNSQNSGNWHEVPVTVTANEGASGEYWATYYNSAQGYTADANTTVYQAAVNGTKTGVVLTEVTGREIPAGQGVVLKSSAATIALTPALTTQTLTGNELLGTDVDLSYPGGNVYCLSKSGTAVGFYTYTSTDGASGNGTIPAHKAYLVVASAARSFLGFGGDDNTTGIALPEAEVIEGEIFDLSGRRIEGQPQKGIYVKSGKKVVIK